MDKSVFVKLRERTSINEVVFSVEEWCSYFPTLSAYSLYRVTYITVTSDKMAFFSEESFNPQLPYIFKQATRAVRGSH